MRPISCSHPPTLPQRLAFRVLAVLALATLPAAASADLRIYGSISGIPAPGPGFGFALHLAREDLALDYDADENSSETLELRRLGITLSESLGERARVGLRLGRLWVSQSGREATAGLDPRGHYLDLVLAADQPLTERVRATIEGSWRYAVADERESDAEREVDLEWQTWTLRPGLRLATTERTALRAGLSLTAVNGDERRRDPEADLTTDFGADGHVGGYLALDLMPQPDDVVTFRFEGGPRTGVFISFEHRY